MGNAWEATGVSGLPCVWVHTCALLAMYMQVKLAFRYIVIALAVKHVITAVTCCFMVIREACWRGCCLSVGYLVAVLDVSHQCMPISRTN